MKLIGCTIRDATPSLARSVIDEAVRNLHFLIQQNDISTTFMYESVSRDREPVTKTDFRLERFYVSKKRNCTVCMSIVNFLFAINYGDVIGVSRRHQYAHSILKLHLHFRGILLLLIRRFVSVREISV